MAKVMKWTTYTKCAELIKSRFKKINEAVDEIAAKGDPPTLAQTRNLSAFSSELARKRTDFEANIHMILDNEEADMDVLSKDQNIINDLYATIVGNIEALMPTNDPPTPTSTRSSESHAAHPLLTVRLPKLELKHFSGDSLSWISFINLFDSTIHSNASLSNVAKFQYLLSVLSGEPLNLVRSLSLSAANYMVAYKLLQDRYHSPRRLITLHLNQVLDLPDISASSPKNMRAFVNLYHENTQALKALNNDISSNNPLLSALLLRKMDNALRQRLEVYRSTLADDGNPPHSLPEVADIIKFLSQECNHVEDANLHNTSTHKSPSSSAQQKPNQGKRVSFASHPVSMVATSTTRSQPSSMAFSCFACNQTTHKVYKCPKYASLNPNQRYKLVKECKRCTSCLGNHPVQECKSQATCLQCQKQHHTSLHFQPQQRPENSKNARQYDTTPSRQYDTSASQQIGTSTQHGSPVSLFSQRGTPTSPGPTTVLLGTTLVKLTAQNGLPQVFRALLDSGSMCDFISERAAQLLGAPRLHSNLQVSGLSQTTTNTKGSVVLNMESLSGKLIASQHQVHVLEKISVDLPRAQISPELLNRVKPYTLADPTFHLPGPIDLLIGGALFSQILTHKSHSLGQSMPHVIGTHFGYVVMGIAPCVNLVSPTNQFAISLLSTSDDLHTSLQKFWQLEELPASSKKSTEEKQCDEHFDSTHTRRDDGRYIVHLPFKESQPALGDSLSAAERRFKALENKFAQNSELESLYSKAMKEHIEQGHMVKVTNPEAHFSSPHYFLPHHGVIKENSSSTKLRIVYDASCKTSSGQSLNDTLMTGRKLQTDICDMLFQFRSHRIVFTCDIRQMYLQIFVEPSHQNFQLVLWRENPSEPVSVYKLTRVTFGVNSSPYLAIRTLHQLAEDEGTAYPEAARVLRSQTYVDDIISGADTLEEALELQNQLTLLLAKGGFELRKWASNAQELLQTLPQDHLETPVFLQENELPHFAVLGLHWSPENDYFTYRINIPKCTLTKRSVLRVIAKIYDPCGFLAPCIMTAKSFMQLLWTTGLGWDEPLPSDLSNKWNTFTSSVSHISQIKIPRALMLSASKNVELHGFSDASENGYAAVVYFRNHLSSGEIIVRQVIAKTRVAPLKKVTLPRLELCGAHLLAQLVAHCYEVFKDRISFTATYLWCDSSVVLTWLQTPPYRLKTFVANRVSQTQELVPLTCWRHIQSAHNPADCASRGILASDLVKHPLWWNGPSWLHLLKEDWPSPKFSPVNLASTEELKQTPLSALTAVQIPEWDLLTKFSSWNRLVRVTAYILRFINNSKNINPTQGRLSPIEFTQATNAIVKLVQKAHFMDDIIALEQKKLCSSKLRRLTPFIDANGLIRVGGRLKCASLGYEAKHPLLLPKHHPVVNSIISHYHVKHLHAGPQLTQALISQKFWILSARSVIRSNIFKCLVCFRQKPKNKFPLMGDLPSSRVLPARPFLHTGVDYGGPFNAKVHNLRGARTIKIYLCLFVCMATKAVHLEVATDLTTEAFIAALTRFVSRRGLCTDIYSDCGTNFVGAKTILNSIVNDAVKSPKARCEIEKFAQQNSINFHFNPPASPNFGGLWESAIKSAKHHLNRVIGEHILTLSEFMTLTTQVEAILNSRPLTPLSSDPADFAVLTPGHFLIGAPLTALPEADLQDLPDNRLRRWQLVQAFNQRIWKRWRSEYLHTLQQRGKWTIPTPDLQVGDLVLLQDNSPPLQWPIGRIMATFPGDDGVVRVVDVRTAQTTYRRPVSKVFPLPAN